MSFAQSLNVACQCIWLDRERLREQLQRTLGDADLLLQGRPGLAAGSVVFIDEADAAAMDRTTRLVHRALASDAFAEHVHAHAPAVAHPARGASGGMLGLDFHLGGSQPQLIEINTNPGGLLVNLELARALTACCDVVAAPLPRLASGDVPLAALPERVIRSFREEWTRVRGDAPMRSIAICDDDPKSQYLYPEFLLYQRLFAAAGLRSLIVDAADLDVEDGALMAGDERIDFVYNRVTDFYFAEERHAALGRAWQSGLAAISPNPAMHARWADKRLLAWLREESLLGAAGLDQSERAQLLRAIPPTEIVTSDRADEFWRRRKEFFFKPVDGYGSKAAYRGDKLTRRTFAHIASHRYVAQAIAPTSTRRVVVEGEATDLRVDLRNYCNDGATWLRAARLYSGQTTNFRTPGGGFAPVLTLPAHEATGPARTGYRIDAPA